MTTAPIRIRERSRWSGIRRGLRLGHGASDAAERRVASSPSPSVLRGRATSPALHASTSPIQSSDALPRALPALAPPAWVPAAAVTPRNDRGAPGRPPVAVRIDPLREVQSHYYRNLPSALLVAIHPRDLFKEFWFIPFLRAVDSCNRSGIRMEAKRRRLSKSADPVTPPRTSVPDGGSPKTTARSTRSATSMAKIVEALREELSSCELEKAQKSLGYLKKKLSSKISVSDFMRSEKSFPTLITVFHESFSKLNDTKAGDSYAAILRETISVIANCCHLSLESCLRLKPANAKVINSALRILESGTRTSWTLKACVLRLIANLCEHKETAMCVVEAPQLVDRIAMMVSAEDENTSKNALRIVRLLSSSFSRIQKDIFV
ncbi:hypothetical protein QR680_009572 [Steinernema hermaphroditum]|uniref:Uncharacterized protein n=1 Tax=Steinernema hermaphroditum TaxID=289476 RepID=A0AA39IN96_9BILA|nr:hypothetical protein QR680_009572 [Steinernema hermaphroditum]